MIKNVSSRKSTRKRNAKSWEEENIGGQSRVDENGDEEKVTDLNGCHQQMNDIVFNIVKAKFPGGNHDSAVDQSNVGQQHITWCIFCKQL